MMAAKTVKCPTCDGSGLDPTRSYTEHTKCPTCNGEGEITEAKAKGIEEGAAAAGKPAAEEKAPEGPDGGDRKN